MRSVTAESGCAKSKPPGLSVGSRSLPSALRNEGVSIFQVSPPSRLRANRSTDGLSGSTACPRSTFLKYARLKPTSISLPHAHIPLLAGHPPKRPLSLKTTTLFVEEERCAHNGAVAVKIERQISDTYFIVLDELLLRLNQSCSGRGPRRRVPNSRGDVTFPVGMIVVVIRG